MDKKQRIILTMLELVVEQGLHATPMSQVAKEANVAVGTIYHYFENKNQIIEEIFEMINKDFSVILMANLPEKDFKKQFEAMWLNLFNYFIGNPLAFKFIEYVAVPPVITPKTMKKSSKHFKTIKDFFLRGIASKNLTDSRLRLLMQFSYGSVVAVCKLKIYNQLEITETELNSAVEMTWNSIKHENLRIAKTF